MSVPTVTLNNGVAMPRFGLGVYQTPPAETEAAVAEALRLGYPLIDTAAAYGNERGVGEAIRKSGIPRERVFIETKLWINDFGYEESLHGFAKSVAKLGVEQIDLLLLHQPLSAAFDRTRAAWRALETLLADGRVRAIGISNFMPLHIERLLDGAKVVPAVNQIEVHPYFQQRDVQELDARHGIRTQAWSPLGGVTFYPGRFLRSGAKSTLDEPVIQSIARAHGKTPAQVMLRWHLQGDRDVIPKTVNPARMTENLGVFDFRLTADDCAAIDALETGLRGGPEPDSISLETFSHPIPEA